MKGKPEFVFQPVQAPDDEAVEVCHPHLSEDGNPGINVLGGHDTTVGPRRRVPGCSATDMHSGRPSGLPSKPEPQRLIQIKYAGWIATHCRCLTLTRNRSSLGTGVTAMNDKQLRQDILDVFQWEPRIDASHIAVVVERGFVTLTGRADSDDEKIAAEHVARQVDGVRDVVLSIEVRAPGSHPTENNKSDPTLDTD